MKINYFTQLGLLLGGLLFSELSISEERGFPLSSSIWSNSNINVCWENLNDSTNIQRQWVEVAVNNTWESVSSIDFTGWGQCSPSSNGIRIGVSDTGPHTKGLGDNLNGIGNGMVLNFTYLNWSTSCQGQEQYCSEVIAVHEFGHALGFAHEQNRDDTPSTCNDAPQGTNGDMIIGAWDLNSVMNYCNPQWSGNGNLSSTDIDMVQQFYGDIFSREYINTSSVGSFITADKTKMDSGSVADINGDGLTDYVVVWNSSGKRQLATYLANSDGSFSEYVNTSSAGSFISDSSGRDIGEFTDINGDGLSDYVVVWNSSGKRQLATYLGLSNGHFSEYVSTASTGSFISDKYGRDIGEFADINGDGRDDYVVVWSSSGKRQLAVYIAKANGTFNEYVNTPSTGNFITSKLGRDTGYFADVNGDGLKDYVVIWNSNGKRQLATYIANINGRFNEYINTSSLGNFISDSNGSDTGKFADINGDGFSDYIVVWNSNGKRRLATYTGNPNGMFDEYISTDSNGSYSPDSHGVDMGDFSDVDGDGYMDYVVVWSANGIRQIATYFGQHNGLFSEYINTPVLGSYISDYKGKDTGHLVDINGDGKSDYLVPWNSSSKRKLAVYLAQ